MVTPLSIGDPNRREQRRRRRQQSRLARRAEEIGSTPIYQEPGTPLGQAGRESLQAKADRRPTTALGRIERTERPSSTLSKIGSAISYTGDLGSAFAVQALTRSPLLRGLIESSAETQEKKGGTGTEKAVYKLISERRKELQSQGESYLSATRQAYNEARENKEFRRGAAFTSEVLFDPLTYLGIGTVSKVFKAGKAGVKSGAEAVGLATKSLKRISSKQKVSDALAEKTINKQGLGKITQTISKIPFIGPYAEKFVTTIKGQNFTLDTSDGIQKAVGKLNILAGIRENRISAAMGAILPSVAKLKFGSRGLASRKTAGEVMFDVDDAGQVAVKVKKFAQDADGKNINLTNITERIGIDEVGKKSKLGEKEFTVYGSTIQKPFTSLDQNKTFVGNVFERAFPVIKDGEGLDDFAQRYFKKQGRENADNLGWLDLDADDLRKFSAFDLNDDQLRYMRNIYKHIDEMGDEMVEAGVDFTKLAQKFNLADGTVTKRAYFPRQLVFQGLGEAQQKSIIKNVGGEGKRTFQKTRKILDDSEFDTQIADLVENGTIKVGNSIDGVIEAYTRGALKLIDEAVVEKEIAKEVFKGGTKTFAMKGDTRARILKEIGKKDMTTSKVKETLRLAGLKRFADDLDDVGLDAIKKRIDEMEKLSFGKNYFFEATDDKFLKKIAALEKTQASKDFSLLGTASNIGDIMRVGRTGFDFGFSLLQGLPMLGLATTKLLTGSVKEAGNLYKAWGTSTKQGFKVLFQKESMETFMAEAAQKQITIIEDGVPVTKSLLQAFVDNGGSLGRKATDIYAGLDNSIFSPSIGQKLAKGRKKLTDQTLRRFEDSYTHASDVLRLKGFEAMYQTASKSDGGLRGLTNFLNKSTGALNPTEAGIMPSQQQIERAFLFFSPRYTRASFSLLADVFRGGLRMNEARQALIGTAAFGLGTYIAMSEALGQEPDLDPRSGSFLQLKLGNDRVGIGSFWRSFTKAAVKIGDSATTEEDIFEEGVLGNSFDYLTGRGSPITNTVRDMWRGANFLGQEFEDKGDLALHIGTQFLPFWAENLMLGDPYRNGIAGTLGEFAGLNARPQTVWDRRKNRRDTLAHDKYGRLFNDLNKVEKDEINKDENIVEYTKLARQISDKNNDEMYAQLEIYYDERDRIKDTYENDFAELSSAVENGLISIRDLNSSDRWKKIKAERRTRYKDFYARIEPGGDLANAGEYFSALGEKYNEDQQVEDQIAEIYIQTVLNNEVFDRPEGYDYRAKEKAEADFINKYGTEMYDYAQQFLASGKTLMPYEAEFLNARKQFEYFWEASEKAVIERESDPETAEAILNDFYALTSAQRDEVLRDSPDAAYIKGLINKVSGVKKALRQQNSGLDGFLYRWGYYDTLVHPDNKNYERVWETTGFIAPDVYQNGLRKFKPNI